MRSVRLIEVPFMCGDGEHPAREGPARVAAAAHELLRARGVRVARSRVALAAGSNPGQDAVVASVAVNRQLARIVGAAVAARQLPLVLAGSCDASLGVLAGFEHGGCGVVWLDAHGDFNTPESSVSGFFPGMSLAVITGHCHRELWAQIGDATPIAEADTLLIGVRDLSPRAEAVRLARSAIAVVAWEGGRATGDAIGAVDAVAERVGSAYLHVDLDVLDPHVAPGVVDDPVPGGLSVKDAEAVVRAMRRRMSIAAAAVTTFVPDRDVDNRTFTAQLRLIEALAVASG